ALGQLRDCGLAAELVLHLLIDADDGLVKLLQAAREPDGGALVSEVSLDLAGDGERGERGEFETEVRVEAVDRLDQPEVAHLDDVVERLAAVLELAREEVHEVAISVNELRANAIAFCGVRALLVATVERPQLLAGRPLLGSQYV